MGPFWFLTVEWDTGCALGHLDGVAVPGHGGRPGPLVLALTEEELSSPPPVTVGLLFWKQG